MTRPPRACEWRGGKRRDWKTRSMKKNVAVVASVPPLLPAAAEHQSKGSLLPASDRVGKKKNQSPLAAKTHEKRKRSQKKVGSFCDRLLSSLFAHKKVARSLSRSLTSALDTTHARAFSSPGGESRLRRGSFHRKPCAQQRLDTSRRRRRRKNINRARREFISFLTTNPTRSSEDVCATPTTLGFFFLFVRAHHLADTAEYAKDAGVPIKRVILHQREDDERR